MRVIIHTLSLLNPNPDSRRLCEGQLSDHDGEGQLSLKLVFFSSESLILNTTPVSLDNAYNEDFYCSYTNNFSVMKKDE